MIPVTLGGDHTVVLPILRAVAAAHGPVGLVHVDAHTDINDTMFGERVTHGTPFRRAVEEGLLDTGRVAQIGVRGTGYEADDFDWSRDQGFRVVPAEECWHRSLSPLMAEIRAQLGDGPVYLELRHRRARSCARSVREPRDRGLTTVQALEIIRGCRGLALVGADLVEVAPIYDTTGATALVAANLVYDAVRPAGGRVPRLIGGSVDTGDVDRRRPRRDLLAPRRHVEQEGVAAGRCDELHAEGRPADPTPPGTVIAGQPETLLR
ncbi:MAG: arginase family protein [Acidimicrobiales bacterium]